MQNKEPKSYLPPEEREELLQRGNMDALYIAESLSAGEAGDEDTAWAWLAQGTMPAEVLLGVPIETAMQPFSANRFRASFRRG